MLDDGVSILACGMGIIVLAIYPLGKIISAYLNHRYERDWQEVQETTSRKGIAVGDLAKLLGRSTLSE